ncbi:MAG: hypothetical protein Alpg2KO_01720 [Alphaproteobacteria bacterium]
MTTLTEQARPSKKQSCNMDLPAAGWGLAEATVFFIVPDVLISWVVARHGLAAGLRACMMALIGAVGGGALLYLCAMMFPAGISSLMQHIPAITPATVEAANGLVAMHGWLTGMTLGSLQGIPYKLFAIQAAETGPALLSFMLVSLPARALRFVLLACVAALLSWLIQRYDQRLRPDWALSAIWASFYLWFFSVAGG